MERRQHLVVAERGRAGDAGIDARILGAKAGDRSPDGRDDLPVVHEVARLATRLDQHEEQLLVA